MKVDKLVTNKSISRHSNTLKDINALAEARMNTMGIAKATVQVSSAKFLAARGGPERRVLPCQGSRSLLLAKSTILEGDIQLQGQARSLFRRDEHLSRHRQALMFARRQEARNALIGRSFRAETHRSCDKILRGKIRESQNWKEVVP